MEKKRQYFIGQRQDEEVLYMSRRHWLPMLALLFKNILLTMIWIVLVDVAIFGVFYMTGYETSTKLFTFLTVLTLLMLIPTLATTWTIYYLTITVITDNRMIKVTQKGIFYNYMREVKLRGLQDTSFTFKNWIQSMFNYGFLVAHSASGEEGKFKVNSLPKPRAVHHYLNQLSQILHNIDTTGVQTDLPKFNEKEIWKKAKRQA